MGNSVVGARGVRSLRIFGAGSGSSPHVRKSKNARLDVRASARELDRIRLLRERRAAALDVNADRLLIGASLRASKRLRSTWPALSAATLSWRARTVPVLLVAFSLVAMLAEPSTIMLAILVVLPAAFRIWVVVHPMPRPPSPSTQDEQEPVYSVIAPLRGEARVVDQLLSAIERLNYPPEKLDVIIAVEAKDHATRAAITARKHRIPITVDSHSCGRAGDKTEGTQCRSSLCSRDIHGDLRRRGQAGAESAARRAEGFSVRRR